MFFFLTAFAASKKLLRLQIFALGVLTSFSYLHNLPVSVLEFLSWFCRVTSVSLDSRAVAAVADIDGRT